MRIGHVAACDAPQDCWCEVRKLSVVLLVTVGILVAEIVGGWLSNSLSLWTDAGHVFGDKTALIVGIVVAILSHYNVDQRKTQTRGFTLNIFLLVGVCIWVLWEAKGRFENPHEVDPATMMIVGFIGAMGNLVQHYLLHQMAEEHKHGVHAVISTHVVYDFLQSIGVVLGGAIIFFTDWYVVDPVISVLIVIWIVRQLPRLYKKGHERNIDLFDD